MGKYQLVVQLEADDADTLEAVAALEEELIDLLDGVAEVEGHEIGDGTANLTFDTDQPKKVWSRLETVLEEKGEAAGLAVVAVAYRGYEDDEGGYTVIWPSDFEGEFEP